MTHSVEVSPDDESSRGARRANVSKSTSSGPPIIASKRKGGGGPTSMAGKRIASQNAITHGITAKSPVIGDEQAEDWEALHAGYVCAFSPVGVVEFDEVYALALLRQQWFRLEKRHTAILEYQIDLVASPPREVIELAHDKLPEDEAIWINFDAPAVLEALKALAACKRGKAIDRSVAAGVILALERSSGADVELPWSKGLEPSTPSRQGTCTLANLHQCFEQVARDLEASPEDVVADALAEAEAAAVLQGQRAMEVERDESLREASAYVINNADATWYLRHSARIENDFDRHLKRLENLQLARTKQLAPPVRLQVSE